MIDQDGEEVIPLIEMVQGVTVTYEPVMSGQRSFAHFRLTDRNPAPFQCSITPRSEIQKRILMEAAFEEGVSGPASWKYTFVISLT